MPWCISYYLYSNPLARFEVDLAYKLHLERNKITSLSLFTNYVMFFLKPVRYVKTNFLNSIFGEEHSLGRKS